MPIPPLIASASESSGGGGGGLPGSGGVARRTPGDVGSLADPDRKPFPDQFDDDASPPSTSTRTET